MATGSEIVEGALRFIVVKTAETPIEPFELNDGMDDLNDMMSEWQGAGLKLGYTRTNDTSIELRFPDFCNAAIKQALGIRIAPQYERIVTPQLTTSAKKSYDRMVKALKVIRVKFPGTLPLGSGNECPGLDLDQRYFVRNKKENF